MRTVLIVSLLLAATLARATPHLDPGKPPASAQQAAQEERRVRAASAGTSAQTSVDTDAEAHLRASFVAADTAQRGTLSRAEAQAGGFGWIANHFDAIDTQRAGRVSFDDVKRYLKSNARGSGAVTK